MNNEQTKTPGEALWRAVYPDLNWVDADQSKFEEWASAVISHVLQGAKWVLLEQGSEWKEGDERINRDFKWESMPKMVNHGSICRRPISLPSSSQPSQAWKTLEMFEQESVKAVERAKQDKRTLAEKFLPPLRPFAHGLGNPEGASATQCASSGDAGAGDPSQDYHVDHYNCIHCGRENSVKVVEPEGETPWVLPPPPAGMKWHRDDWTKDMLPEGYRPLLLDERDEDGDQQLSEGEWITLLDCRFKTTEDERHCRTRRPLPQSAEPVVEEKPDDGFWKDKCQYLEGLRDRLTSERDQLRKELEEANGSFPNKLMTWIVKFIEKHGWTPHPESIGWWGHPDYPEQGNHIGYMFALEFMGEQFTRLKQELKHASELEQNERAIRVSFENELKGLEQELTRLRSQLTWTPISEAPKDGTRILAKTEGSDPHVQFWHAEKKLWMINYADGPSWQPTHFLDLSKLPPLPSPPETEEQAMRREYDAWLATKPWPNQHYVPTATEYGHGLRAYQAAKQSPGGQA